MKRYARSTLPLALALLIPVAGSLQADAAKDIDKWSVSTEAEMKAGRSPDLYYRRLSEDVGVDVAVLRAHRARYRLGYGEFYVAYLIAHESEQPIEVIVADWRVHRGWGVIAKARGVKLGSVVSTARKSSRAWATAKADKPDSPGKADTAQVNRGGGSSKSGSAGSSSGASRGKGGGKKK